MRFSFFHNIINIIRGSDFIKKIYIHDKLYPKQLKTIPNPPQSLYLEGNIEESNMENGIIEETDEAEIQEENTLETNTKITTDEYFTNSRLERNTMYSQQIENYQDILSNTNVSEAQKKVAQEEITRISNEQNAIMIAENLIKTKGIEDLMIFVNNESVNVIVKGNEPTKEEIAQIQNIISRELNAEIENIHISTK